MVLLSFSLYTFLLFLHGLRKLSEISKRSSLCQKKCRYCTLPMLLCFDYSTTAAKFDA